MNRLASLLVALLALGLPAPAGAGTYKPAIATFDGTNSIYLPPDDSLDLEQIGTIEFWVAASWDDTIGYDPAIVSYMGTEGPRYSVHITADKQKIGLFAGAEWDETEFDFSDGKLHYVALVTYEGITEIYIDGKTRAAIGVGYAEEIIGDNLCIGSLNGVDAPFIGALAGLRIWSTTVEEEDLAAFRAVDIRSEEGSRHPDYDSLVGAALFDDGQRGFGLTQEPQSYLSVAEEVDAELDREEELEAAESAEAGAAQQ